MVRTNLRRLQERQHYLDTSTSTRTKIKQLQLRQLAFQVGQEALTVCNDDLRTVENLVQMLSRSDLDCFRHDVMVSVIRATMESI